VELLKKIQIFPQKLLAKRVSTASFRRPISMDPGGRPPAGKNRKFFKKGIDQGMAESFIRKLSSTEDLVL